MKKKPLTFDQLKKANLKRAKTFKHKQDLSDWSAAEWSNAMAGEVGEVCNLTKKLRRKLFKTDNINLKDIGLEIADVVTYADLLASRLGLNLGELVREKFNIVSNRVKHKGKL